MHAQKNPKLHVSIVIPVYNEAKHLRYCLDAIAAQTVAPVEVIVVDNNSSDESRKIAESYQFVKVIEVTQQGIVHARNAGFQEAQGDIIGRIDADILLPPNWVEHIIRFYQQPDHLAYAWTGSGWFYNVRLPRLVSHVYSVLAFRLNHVLIGQYTLWGSNMALLRSQWQSVANKVCLDNDIHEDLDLAIHLKQAGYAVTYDTKIKTHAELRRVHAKRNELWDYLQWWPRTLRRHDKRSWILCWVLTVIPLYLGAVALIVSDKVAPLVGRPALRD